MHQHPVMQNKVQLSQVHSSQNQQEQSIYSLICHNVQLSPNKASEPKCPLQLECHLGQ